MWKLIFAILTAFALAGGVSATLTFTTQHAQACGTNGGCP
jgi:hypothetical protein